MVRYFDIKPGLNPERFLEIIQHTARIIIQFHGENIFSLSIIRYIQFKPPTWFSWIFIRTVVVQCATIRKIIIFVSDCPNDAVIAFIIGVVYPDVDVKIAIVGINLYFKNFVFG